MLMLLVASIGLVFWSGLKQWLHARQAQRNNARQPPPVDIALAKVQAFSASHPDWGLRVYETPKGLRVIVTHAAFSPSSPEVQALFQQLGLTRCTPCCATSSSAFAPASAANHGAWA
jgi:hypothetical protein